MLLGLCQTPAAEIRHLMALFHESREKGWLQFPESAVPDQVRTLIEQEQLANAITVWSLNLVPGLLQVPAYMRAVAQESVNVQDVEEVVATRTTRREIVNSSRAFTFLVHEQALRLPVGSAETMAEQLHELLRMSVRPYVDLRIVPTATGANSGLSGSFTKLGFEKFAPVVFQDSYNSSLFLEDKDSLAVYQRVLDALDQQTLTAAESRELITSIAT